LPTPVSPSSNTDVPTIASLRASATTSRIAGLWAMTPGSGSAAAGAARAPASSTTSVVAPSRSRVPGATVARSTRVVPTSVPLVLPRSTTARPSAAWRTSRW
jgi:hypothetical protein